jgi:O-antigen/teichoic acid export membrane protein
MSASAERIMLRTAIIGSAVNIALNAVLIPRYGRDGAAAATVVGEALSFVLLMQGVSPLLRRPRG